MRAMRSSLPTSVVAQRSRAAALRLLPLLARSDFVTVALYSGVARERELDASLAHHALLERGARVVYPRVSQRRPPELAFCVVADLATLQPGAMGVREPAADAEVVPLPSIDVFVVPGVAFDSSAGRLGYGGGYYDATLSRCPRALRIGYCHDEQILDPLPMSTLDQRIDVLVTPDRTLSWTSRLSASLSGDHL